MRPIIRNYGNDIEKANWHKSAGSRGYRSITSLPAVSQVLIICYYGGVVMVSDTASSAENEPFWSVVLPVRNLETARPDFSRPVPRDSPTKNDHYQKTAADWRYRG